MNKKTSATEIKLFVDFNKAENLIYAIMPGWHTVLRRRLSGVLTIYIMHCRFAPFQGRINLCCLSVAECGS